MYKLPPTKGRYTMENVKHTPKRMSKREEYEKKYGPYAQAVMEQEDNRKLKEINMELLEALKKFVHYAENGKHPAFERYIQTAAGEMMLKAIAKAEGR